MAEFVWSVVGGWSGAWAAWTCLAGADSLLADGLRVLGSLMGTVHGTGHGLQAGVFGGCCAWHKSWSAGWGVPGV